MGRRVPPGIPVNPWPLLVDAEGWPLLIDTGKWGAAGTALGANTEHNGRTYIFFGDVAPTRGSGIPINADMVAWIDDQDVIFHGGHLALGWNFILPFQPTSDWRFCGKCGSLFWDGDPNIKGFCHKDQGIHVAIGLNFVIPAAETGAHDGQPNWSFCGKCGGLFWNGDPAFNGVCPKDGQPHFAIGWNFHLPFVTDVYIPTGRPEQADWRFCGKVTTLDLLLSHPSFQEDGTHQGNWRFCGKCARLFWDGDFKFKGLCPKDGAGHSPIGLNFMLPHDVPEETQHQQQWRFCGKCGGRFWNGQDPNTGVCPRDGAGHSAIGINCVLPHGFPEDTFNQRNWRFCGKCFGLFWDGDPNFKGTCPQDGTGHISIGDNFVLAHNPGEDVFTEGGWRFCTRRHSAVFTRWEDRFSWVAPRVIENAQHAGLPSSTWEH
jgi:hypothetical protein